jgi:hypothetical protein
LDDVRPLACAGRQEVIMRSLKLLTAAALLAIPSTALHANATNHFGETVQEVQDFCRNVVLPMFYPIGNLGECVSFSLTFGTYGYAQHECDAARDLDPDFDIDFGSYANCVHLLHGDTV